MRRIPAVLLLATLLLPYASAPLCVAGSHAHPGHDRHHASNALETAGHDAMGGMDCHALMQCDLTVQAPHAIPDAPAVTGPRLAATYESRPFGLRGPTRTPHPPPPRTV